MSTKISALPQATALTGAEQVPLVQDGETRRVPAREIAPIAVGLVGSEGALVAGRGATISKPSTGQYEIAVPGAHGIPICAVTPVGAMVAHVVDVLGHGQPVVVRFFDAFSGQGEAQLVDASFSFVVFDVGPMFSS